MSLTTVLVTYTVLLSAVPLIVNSAWLRIWLLPRLLNLVPTYPTANVTMACVGFVTVYVYFLIGFILQIMSSFPPSLVLRTHGLTANRSVIAQRLTVAHNELLRLLPGYAVCCFLMWANTSQYDLLRNRETYATILQMTRLWKHYCTVSQQNEWRIYW
ncbi:hypothetical protein BDF14DRAFT_1884691 [Spinellus fusiger]|nr:hypothetical protein BDF14DRAFT_1884691 [Spinellus fusiger]